MNAANVLVNALTSRLNQNAADNDKLRLKCEYVGAPVFMHEFMVLMAHKTSFDIHNGSTVLLQPFYSGKFSSEDALQISEATGWLINVLHISNIADYENELASLFAKLK